MAKTPVVGVGVSLKLDDMALHQSQQKGQSAADKMADAMSGRFTSKFLQGAQIDPTKLANAAQFAQQGTKAGRAMGDAATDALKRGDFQGAAKDAAQKFSRTLELSIEKTKPKIDTSNMQREGGSAGDDFASGFASAGGLAKLAGRGGPIAAAIIAAVGVAVKTVQPMVEDAMKIDAAVAMAGARGGLSSTQLAEYRKFATEAWGRNSGASIEANVSTAVTAMQSGLGADQSTIESLNAVSSILGEEIPAAARSAGQLIRTGLAGSAKEALDILVSGQQNGLNVSQDWLDTIDEYSTQFRALGLTGADAIGLLSQMTKAGARNTDVAADALKELAIRAQDGSKATTDAFNRLGLNAAEMASKISAGGDTARAAFDQILDAIRNTRDPVQQMQIAVALLGTKAEDLGDAFKAIDLTTAANSINDVEGAAQNAADTALRTSQNEWAQAGRNIEKIWQSVKDSLNVGEWFSQIPKSFNELFADAPTLTPGAPGVPLFSGPGPTIAPPGTPGANLNPLDVITGQHANGTPAAPGAPAPGPAPGMWFGPNVTRPVDNPRWGSQYDRAAEERRGGSSGQSDPVVPFSGSAMDLLKGLPVNSSTYGAAQSLYDAQHRVDTAQAALNAIRASNTATAQDILKRENDLQAAQSDQLQAQMRFNEQMMQATQTATDGMSAASDAFGEIGANLDSDLGFSKGLPGLADNLVRFIASLAAAPIQGMLAPIANGAKGTGILGMLGVGSEGNTSYTQGYAQNSPSGTSYGAYPGDAALLSRVVPGDYVSEAGVGDLTQGIGDCTSTIEDLINLWDGLPTAGRSMATGNAAEWLAGRGFVRGEGGPGDFRVGFNPSHMQATLPGGTNWNWGSREAAQAGGVGGSQGAYDPSLTERWYRPATGGPSAATSTPWMPQAAGNPGGLAMPAPMSSAALAADPSLTNPALSGLPAPGSFPGAGGPLGSGFPQGLTPSYAPSTPSESASPGWTPVGGGQAGISGGLLGTAMSAASSAAGMGANLFAPGSGQAAQAAADMAMKAINRTIAFGGQAAGIAMEGLMSTFGVSDPDGGTNGLGQSWLTRIAGGLSGMKPAGGMSAGKADQKAEADPRDPRNQQPKPGNTVNITNNLQNGQQRNDPQQLLADLGYMQQSAHM